MQQDERENNGPPRAKTIQFEQYLATETRRAGEGEEGPGATCPLVASAHRLSVSCACPLTEAVLLAYRPFRVQVTFV